MLVTVVLLLSYYSYLWQLLYGEGNKHHLLRGLLAYLSILQEHPQSSLRIRGCSLLEKAITSNWFSNLQCAAVANWCGCSILEEKFIHNPTALEASSGVNWQPVRTPWMKKLEEETGGFCSWLPKKWLCRDQSQLWEVTGAPWRVHACVWTEAELKTTEWFSLAPTWLYMRIYSGDSTLVTYGEIPAPQVNTTEKNLKIRIRSNLGHRLNCRPLLRPVPSLRSKNCHLIAFLAWLCLNCFHWILKAFLKLLFCSET